MRLSVTKPQVANRYCKNESSTLLNRIDVGRLSTSRIMYLSGSVEIGNGHKRLMMSPIERNTLNIINSID